MDKRRTLIAAAAVAAALSYAAGCVINDIAMKPRRRDGSRPLKGVKYPEGSDELKQTYRRLTDDGAEWVSRNPPALRRISRERLSLCAEVYETHPQSHKWAVVVHGYASRAADMKAYVRLFSEEGYNVLAPDLRTAGRSDGDWIGMGWPDRLDLVGWILSILRRDADAEIILYGISMGGATVLMTSGEPLPDNVKGIISDCAYTGVYEILAHCLKSIYKLPPVPAMQLASAANRRRQGYYFSQGSTLRAVKNARVPVLLIHGAEDTFVPSRMAGELYDAIPGPKELRMMENAAHGVSYFADPEKYRGFIHEFLCRLEEGYYSPGGGYYDEEKI